MAPIKVVSLLKLELCGALLLSKLIKYVTTILERQPSQIYCWTDSEIVLAWLQGHPSHWKTFIANRVSEIYSSFPCSQWHQVSSQDNPADLASRGVSPAQLQTSKLWREGPDWFKNHSRWPILSNKTFSTDLELKRKEVKIFWTHNGIFGVDLDSAFINGKNNSHIVMDSSLAYKCTRTNRKASLQLFIC